MPLARTLRRCLLTVAFLALPGALLAAQWYTSDETGVLHDRITAEAASAAEYAVNVERSASSETHRLYHNGVEIGRTELVYADSLLVTRRVYENGELTTTEHFRYWADGALRTTRRVEGANAVEYRYRDERLAQEWSYTGADVEQIVYDSVGRIAERKRWTGDEEVEHETREYWGPSADDGVKVVTLVMNGVTTVDRYDESGKLLGGSVASGERVTSERERIYDGDLLVEEREQVGGVLRRWVYDYTDGVRVRETYTEDGVLVRVTDYLTDAQATGEYDRVETIYHNGVAALRVYYLGRERVREEVLRDGEVVRTRTFETAGEAP